MYTFLVSDEFVNITLNLTLTSQDQVRYTNFMEVTVIRGEVLE